MTQITIRPLHKRELEPLLYLYTHLHEQDDPLPDHELIAQVWDEIHQGNQQIILGGFIQERLVCSCVLVLIPNLTRGCRPYGVIENVVSHQMYRGNGYGRQLLQHALQLAWQKRCYKVMLMTGRLNEATFRFYESVGFQRGTKQAFIAKPPSITQSC